MVGGRNSANTLRLAEIVESAGVRAIHAESERDLREEMLGEAARIGVVAGASTPPWSIERVAEWLREHRR